MDAIPRPRSDERLVAQLRAGHLDAFEAIYDRHHAQILAFCRHMLGSREDAEDAAQHTFIAAHRDLVESTKPLDLRPWLYAIARNRCLSMLRARREVAGLDEAIPAGTEGLAEVVQRRQDLRDLVGDLVRLPDDQRAALVLFELGDLSQAEIGRVLGREAAQVKALVFQARTSLMQEREAREIDCRSIREELASARGPALLRGHLRRHVGGCDDCRAYAEQVKRQRVELGLLLPVIPTAGLKAATLAAVTGGGAAGGSGLGALALGGAKGLAVKGLAALALTGGAVGTTIAVDHHHRHARPSEVAAANTPRSTSARSATPTPVAAVSLPPESSASSGAAARRTVRVLREGRAHRQAPSLHSHPAVATPQTPAATTTTTTTSSSSSSSHRPASTPVAGAKRQSTGHAEKSQSGGGSSHPAHPAHPAHPTQAQGPKPPKTTPAPKTTPDPQAMSTPPGQADTPPATPPGKKPK